MYNKGMSGLYFRPRVGLVDTAPAMERRLTESFRRMTPYRRLAQTTRLIAWSHGVSARAFRAARAGASETAIRLAWYRALHGSYPPQLAQWLACHPPEHAMIPPDLIAVLRPILTA